MKSTRKRVSRVKEMIKPIGLIILMLFQPNIKTAQAKNAKQTDTPATLCPAELDTAIETVTKRPEFSRERWGILIQTQSADTLYSQDAQKFFIPASNAKLLTTAAVLQLGSQFRIRTSVYATRDGGLRVVGRGDPSLTDAQLIQLAQQLKQRGIRQVSRLIADDKYFLGATVNPSWEWSDVHTDYGAPVNSLILNQNAVKLTLFPQQIGQPLLVIWSDPIEAKQWQISNESITTESAESTTVNISRESKTPILKITGQLNIDEAESVSLAVVDPVAHFMRHWRRALANQGISESVFNSTAQNSVTNKQPLLLNELAVVESPPLFELLKETNQNSNNLYAEALLRVLGARLGKLTTPTVLKSSPPAKSRGVFTAGVSPDDPELFKRGGGTPPGKTGRLSADTSLDMGLGVVKATLTEMGVDPSGYVLVDGSGLSRHNLVTPEALAQTLRAMNKSPLAAIYRASLPVAGRLGTLKDRFRNTPAAGIVQAKTGTLTGVVALSGYIEPPSYEPLVFSIIVNQTDQNAATIRQAVDEIVLLLTRLRRC